MHVRLPHIELDAIWQPAGVRRVRLSGHLYNGLHSTPTELRYDAYGTHHTI